MPLACLTPAAPHAAPLHGCWGLLHGPWGLLHDCWGLLHGCWGLLHNRWGLLHGRQPVHAAPGTPLRAACSHGRRAPPPQAACTAQRPFWEQPPAPHRTGAVEQPERAMGSPSLAPQPHGVPKSHPAPCKAPHPQRAFSPRPVRTRGSPCTQQEGKGANPEGLRCCAPPGIPSSTGTPQCPPRGPRWGPGAGGAAGPGREARAALCPSVSFYGADKEELQE